MTRSPNHTSARVLDHVERLLHRTALGARDLPARAWLIAAGGRVTRFDLPAPRDTEDYRALGAILGLEMRERQCRQAVLQLPAAVPSGPAPVELVGLYRVTAAGRLAECRLLALRRAADGRIACLLRQDAAAQGGDSDHMLEAVALAPATRAGTARRPSPIRAKTAQ